MVSVLHSGQRLQLPLLVVDKGDTALLGRDWLTHRRPDWPSIMAQVHTVSATEDISDIIKKFSAVFEDGLGEYRHGKVRLNVAEDAQSRFFKARPVPYALRERVDAELQRLEAGGIITAVKHSDWPPQSSLSLRMVVSGSAETTLRPSIPRASPSSTAASHRGSVRQARRWLQVDQAGPVQCLLAAPTG